MNFQDFKRRDLRLTILKALNAQAGFTGNEKLLQMEAEVVGLVFTREQVRTEMRFLEALGAIGIREAGSVMIAVLRQRGADHVKGLAILEGVEKPSPEF